MNIINSFSPMMAHSKALGASLYKFAAQYNGVVEKTATVAGYVKDGGVGIAQFGLGALDTCANAASDPRQAVKDWTYLSFGGNNFADAAEAIKKKSPVTTTDENGTETTTTDIRTLPQRMGEASGHVARGISKASTSAGYYPALVLGTVSNLTGMQMPVSECPTSFDIFHTASKTVASVTSFATTTVASTTWAGAKMAGTAAYNVGSAMALDPSTTAQLMNLGVTSLGVAGSFYVATSNFTKAVDANTLSGKAKHSALAVAGLVGSVAIPAIIASEETKMTVAFAAVVGIAGNAVYNSLGSLKAGIAAMRG